MRQESCTVSYPTWSINECSDFSSYAEWIETERRKRLYDSNFAITFLNKLRELFQKLSIQEQQEKKKKFFSFYEETLTVWPTWGRLCRMYAEAVEVIEGHEKALEIYERFIYESHSLEFFISYVKCVYKKGHLLPLVDALTLSISRVGMDIRSAPLWRELLALRIKMQNMKLTTDDTSTTEKVYFLDIFFSYEKKKKNSERLFTDEKLNLLVSAAQDLIISLPSMHPTIIAKDKHLEQITKRLPTEQTVEKIRTIYRDWLTTPTNDLDIVWEGYKQFESTVAQSLHRVSNSRSMCVKFLTSAKECFSESKKVYKQLCLLMKDIQNLTTTNIDQITDIPSCPNSEATFIQNQILHQQWSKTLSYEATNPLKLSTNFFLNRMQHIFHFAFNSCSFLSNIWISYIQTLLCFNLIDQSIKSLEKCLKIYLPKDELLVLLLADLYRSGGHIDQCLELLFSFLIHQKLENHSSDSPFLCALKECIPSNYTAVLLPLFHRSCHEKPSVITSVDTQNKPEPIRTVIFFYLFNLIRTITVEPFDALVNLINFEISFQNAEETHFFFSHLHSFVCKEVYIFYSTLLFRCYGNKKKAIEVLNVGYQRFNLNETYCILYSQSLLQMGLLQESRTILFQAINEYFHFFHKPPFKLWKEIFRLETFYGSDNSNTLQEYQCLFAQQICTIKSQERIALNADAILLSHYISPTNTIPPDISDYAWPNTPEVSQALTAGIPTDADAHLVLKNYGMYSRLFRCGVLSLEEMLQNWNYDLNLQPESEATIFSKDSFSNNKPYYHVTLVPQIHCAVDQDNLQKESDEENETLCETVSVSEVPSFVQTYTKKKFTLCTMDPVTIVDATNSDTLQRSSPVYDSPKCLLDNSVKTVQVHGKSIPNAIHHFLSLLPLFPRSYNQHTVLVENIVSSLRVAPIPSIDIRALNSSKYSAVFSNSPQEVKKSEKQEPLMLIDNCMNESTAVQNDFLMGNRASKRTKILQT